LLPRIRANLARLFAPAEDPRQGSSAAAERQLELLGRLQMALREVAASKAQLATQTERLAAKLPELEQLARKSLAIGQEDLARLALQRRRAATVELRRLEAQVTEVALEETRLALAEQRLAARIEELRTRHEVVTARYTAAEAQVRISEALAGVSQELADLGIALQEAEERTEAMQARASAIDDLVQAGVLAGPGAARSPADEPDSADERHSIDAELEALRREVERDDGKP
jgi:phage shock protein A